MVQLAADQYVGVLPALGCPGSVDYYFRVEANNHELCALPYEAPFRYFTTESDSHAAVHVYDSESTDGFTVISNGATSGVWESAKPLTGTGVPYGDFDYSGKAWVTDNRDGFDVDGGPVQLLTPVQDLSTSTRVVLSYARWFGCNRGDDRLVVQVSANGGATWKTLENVSSQPSWREMTFELASLIPLTSNVRVRFSVTDSPDNSTTEAGIDAITFRTYRCTPACAADFNLDGFVDYTDFDDFVTLFEAGSAASDANGDGFLDFTDFDAFVASFEAGC
jgi:hypothetical protein